ncbi:hypothetical protein J2Y69_003241 [Microbacterium resistens]|uniref:Uncharacterized protein n=1 Tax=Microbacterium resistens TaxID=156977 RepID=A0ABU1SG68_9MICO|nr:hypothetical protein [Microbacterium resistens]MDR6868617.1 hypothetical protein [Microbacterium resistens]
MAAPSVSDFPSSYAAAHGRIQLRPFGAMPAVVRHLELQVADRADAFPVLVSVSDEMNLAPVVALEVGTAWLTPATLATWGVSVEIVASDALASLGDLEVDVRRVGRGAFVVHGEVFAGAVWGRPQLVSGLGVSGNPVVWNAGDGVTLVTGDEASEGFQIAVAVLTERLQSGVELETLTPHRMVDDAWTPSVWPASVQDALRTAERLFARQWYERQREPLREHYQSQGHEMNVPEYRVMDTPQGEVVSACACVVGVPNLIPDVDTVLLIQPDGTARPYSFAEFRDQFAVSMQDAGMSPPRWLTLGQ